MNKSWSRLFLPLLVLAAFIAGLSSAKILDNKIVKEMVIGAEKLVGFNFTDAHIDSMLDGVNSHLSNYENIRKYDLNNNVIPALIFNPIPAGYVNSIKDYKSVFTNYTNLQRPSNPEDIAFYPIGKLAALVREKKISCEELTRFYIDRLKKYNPQLHCVITFTEEYAINQSRKLDKEIKSGKYRGPLHGIPFGLKDLFSVSGYPTTWGAVPYKNQVIDYNSTVFKKLEDAGGVLVAKLTMGELAMGDVWFGGKTRNPWDTSKGSSGSSAGSASAVSAGLLPFAIGTETWGSIISPSTTCGITGLRPTFGRVSRSGAMALSWSMDKAGPICRNAEDCAIVFNVIKGRDEQDPVTVDYPFSFNSKADIKKLRVGYLKNYFNKKYDLSDNDSLTLIELKKQGFEMTPVEFNPGVPLQDLAVILEAEAGAAFQPLVINGKEDEMVLQGKNAWPNTFRTAQFIPAVEYINANRLRTKLINNFNDLIKKYDILVFPSLEDDSQLLTNLTGHPCLCIPTGFNSSGLPTSITLVGNLYDEGTILSAAYHFQTNMKQLERPPLTSK